MWDFKSMFMIVLLCCTVSLSLGKPLDDDDDDTPTTCNEDMIDMAHRYLEHYKQVYDLIEMPNFHESMKSYEEVLKDLRKYHQYLVDNCPESNHTHYGEYLEKHALMEECIEGFLTDEDDKELKCFSLKDQSNIDFMVHAVVSNSTEGFGLVMNYCIFAPDMAHKILVLKALSQERDIEPDNYKKLYFRIKKYLEEETLSSEEHVGLLQVLRDTLWSASKSRPMTTFDEITADIHNFNSTLSENLVQDLVEEKIKGKTDVSQILSFLGHVKCETSQIRGVVYICEHIDDYSDKSEIQLQLAYVMRAIMEEESYEKVNDAQLLISLTEALDSLPSFAKEFFVSGQFCLFVDDTENQEYERVFLVDGNQHLFTPKEDGTSASCDFGKMAKVLFHKEIPPKDLIGDMKCKVGDFHPTGEHGVDCNLKLEKSNVFACDDSKYIIEGPSKFFELQRLAGEQMTNNLKKFEEHCVAHE